MDFAMNVLDTAAVLFVWVLGLALLALAVLFAIDRMQTADAVRRNYPVVGRFRHLFTKLGEFFRQYFFAMDREELPFNRAQRDWVERASKGEGNTLPFGSTRNISVPGTPLFVNAAFPHLDSADASTEPMVIGAGARVPYAAPSFFNISGMSYGSISKPAVQALSRGAAQAGIWMNTGEGGLSEYHLEGGCDVVFQIGTAKYGVRTEDGALDEDKLRDVAAHDNVRMFEIKLAQGAKPGKGGILPAAKVTDEIAKVRGIEKGTDSISPNRHPEIDSPASLLDFVNRVRDITGKPVGVKLVVGSARGVAPLFDEIVAQGPDRAPDFITVDGGEGGTGAAPMPLMDLVGLTIREALPIVVGLRNRAGLKDRIRIIASAKMMVPGDVAWALATGADFCVSARGFMFSLGCIQALRCNRNTCPTGITTHNERFQKGLVPKVKKDRVAQFARQLVKEVEMIAHSVGVSEPRRLRPEHVRVVQENGTSVAMDRLHDVQLD
ncbi:FMN-binding glutamate synthase family protein [Pseudaestuariivita atlantica]|uniref:Glutamate synthase n=1 Tax=Pseudaestuariivita atlantica TaxID=1317121 RepID=A0A0L1JTF6_9RHOB|nr:FMN-binding glutamate synthase family protein [Pseudaestuariivita atlantica]KNG95025.1 glutamate synthase [Pseudaestuariivita atlantica]